jgi:hypothetical protein
MAQSGSCPHPDAKRLFLAPRQPAPDRAMPHQC